MKQVHVGMIIVTLLCVSVLSQAQQTVATSTNAVVPPLVKFGGILTDVNSKPLSGVVGVTFALYKDQQGGAPLWLETQNVTADKTGHYSIMLGSTSSEGLPADIFVAGEARWLAVQPEGQAEQTRVLLLSVPYALKAGDAQTLGGLPASAFVLAAPAAGSPAPAASAPDKAAADTASSASPLASSDVTTTGGTANALPMFTTATNIQNSLLTQTGTTTINVGGKLNLPATGTATSAAGFNSRPTDFVASVFNSTTSTAVPQTFQWQAQPVGNDTATASGTLNLLYASGTATPAGTGLHIASNGQITFAAGQTFPGTGDGSVTSVATGLGLKGGPITKTGTLTIDTTKVPQLAVANTFTANQTIGGILTVANSSLAVHGTSAGASATGVGRSNAGVWGDTGGAAGTGYAGVLGTADGNSAGWFLNNGASATVFAANSGSGYGVVGQGGSGVVGTSTLCCGVGGAFTGFSAPSGSGQSGTAGIAATGGTPDPEDEGAFGGDGVDGYGGNNTAPPASASGGNGVFGQGGDSTGIEGVDGIGGLFMGGSSSAEGDGVQAYNGSGYAGRFFGNVAVIGTLTASTKHFKIDHPLEPANKYLVHASVESSEMKNIYDGVVTTDAQGEATVQLPDWFEALNTDFRYQLTVIGQFAQAIVARKIEDHQFQVRTSAPNVEVSWQVTGVRQDAYAKAHPLVVEEEKEPRLRGYYIHPELYGAPEEKGVEWARHPQMMKRMKEARQKQLAQARQGKP